MILTFERFELGEIISFLETKLNCIISLNKESTVCTGSTCSVSIALDSSRDKVYNLIISLFFQRSTFGLHFEASMTATWYSQRL